MLMTNIVEVIQLYVLSKIGHDLSKSTIYLKACACLRVFLSQPLDLHDLIFKIK